MADLRRRVARLETLQVRVRAWQSRPLWEWTDAELDDFIRNEERGMTAEEVAEVYAMVGNAPGEEHAHV